MNIQMKLSSKIKMRLFQDQSMVMGEMADSCKHKACLIPSKSNFAPFPFSWYSLSCTPTFFLYSAQPPVAFPSFFEIGASGMHTCLFATIRGNSQT